MTTATLHKHATITYNPKGQPISVQLNLKNRIIRQAYENMMEDVTDAMMAMQRDDNDTISHEEVKARILSLQNKR
jgi:beta-mannanase